MFKCKLTDLLVPVFGPIDAFCRTYVASEENLHKYQIREISSRQFKRNELFYTSYVAVSSIVSTAGLIYLLDKIVR